MERGFWNQIDHSWKNRLIGAINTANIYDFNVRIAPAPLFG